jgi:hypothetical protein
MGAKVDKFFPFTYGLTAIGARDIKAVLPGFPVKDFGNPGVLVT